MDNANPILTWYANLTNPTADDRADLEVMLMDTNNSEDAQYAVTGLIQNTLVNGYNEKVVRLLILCAHKQNVMPVRAKAMAALIFMATTFDDLFRQSQPLQEDVLDMLADQHEEALLALAQYARMRKHMIVMGKPQKDIRQTLIYSLIVLGEDEQKMFE
ncbi:MAG: hypothetical protein K5660_08650 [Paludibacteraceae bacterium]|nr:hypothetical protein [Paludibacteraceae bacterium]